ncbi:hypothetical protein GCM10025876_36390 [Demequina litorisediminis]|uniref:Anthranilate synthase component I N-terminal domain-containing protein n=1 Tax=Demequina litorisediminis TaxID=1849022 RepID=A0ABQ6IHS7_9MICO|nr:hypothetical protein GCM10025876_36390 [Demequina litorisediminis]
MSGATAAVVRPAWGETWPTLERFVEIGATRRVVPVVRRVLADGLTPVAVYRALGDERAGTFILESAEPDGTRGRFSFVGADSRATLTIQGDDARWAGDVPVGLTNGAPLETIRHALREPAVGAHSWASSADRRPGGGAGLGHHPPVGAHAALQGAPGD